jgi:hypothetical protein
MWALTKGSLRQGHVRVLGHIGGAQTDDTKVDDVDHNLDGGVGRGTKNFACEFFIRLCPPITVNLFGPSLSFLCSLSSLSSMRGVDDLVKGGAAKRL